MGPAARQQIRIAADLQHWSYLCQDSIRQKVRKIPGAGAVEFIYGPEHDTEAFIVSIRGVIYVTIRGSEGLLSTDADDGFHGVKDWWGNLRAIRSHGMHKGFRAAASEILPEMKERIPSHHQVVVIGHSRGAGIALALVLLGAFPLNRTEVELFGSPRVVDSSWIRPLYGVVTSCRRWLNHRDGIAYIPPAASGYTHVGRLMYFDRNGKLWPDGYKRAKWERMAGFAWGAVTLGRKARRDHSHEVYRDLVKAAV